MSHPVVSIAKCADYDIERIRESLTSLLEPLGGIENFVEPGQKVLLKINLLRSSDPSSATTTHPVLVEAVIELVQKVGGLVTVGDSPGGPNLTKQTDRLLEKTQLREVCDRTGADLVIFDRDLAVISTDQGKLYSSFNTGKAVGDADVIITIPKLKTHGFMVLTGAVKILFGIIPGMEKAQFHLKVPRRIDFAEMLLDIYLAVKPSLSIMDAIVGMEGEGPSSGNPKQIGLLMASQDSVALDIVSSKVIGLDPMGVYTNRAAINRKLIDDPENIVIIGEALETVKVVDFVPASSDVADKLPGRLVEFLKNISTSKPYLDMKSLCSGCGTCAKVCPAAAISIVNKKPLFDYKKCIRCYCCEELCTELAIKRKSHWVTRPFIRHRR